MDAIVELAGVLKAIEIKSGKTINNDFFKSFRFFDKLFDEIKLENFLVYGGDSLHSRSLAKVVGWKYINNIFSDISWFFGCFFCKKNRNSRFYNLCRWKHDQNALKKKQESRIPAFEYCGVLEDCILKILSVKFSPQDKGLNPKFKYPILGIFRFNWLILKKDNSS